MSSLYIRNTKYVKFPHDCDNCDFAHFSRLGNIVCPLVKDIVTAYTSTRHEKCPLSEVSEHHGRLIDADRFKAVLLSAAGANSNTVPLDAVLQLLNGSPTTIEAEEVKNE
jgi:hypothetical protein